MKWAFKKQRDVQQKSKYNKEQFNYTLSRRCERRPSNWKKQAPWGRLKLLITLILMLKSNYCISITRVYRWEASQFGGRVNSESSSVNTADITELLSRNKQKKVGYGLVRGAFWSGSSEKAAIILSMQRHVLYQRRVQWRTDSPFFPILLNNSQITSITFNSSQ